MVIFSKGHTAAGEKESERRVVRSNMNSNYECDDAIIHLKGLKEIALNQEIEEKHPRMKEKKLYLVWYP